MNNLREDIRTKHKGNLANGARAVGISRQALYDLLDRYEMGGKVKLSSYLMLARILGISYNKFKEKYLTS